MTDGVRQSYDRVAAIFEGGWPHKMLLDQETGLN